MTVGAGAINVRGSHVPHEALAQVVLEYRGKRVSPPAGCEYVEVECEVYEEDGLLSVHTACPRCRHNLWIDGRHKDVRYDASRGLFVEPFRCTWELTDKMAPLGTFGTSLCGLRVAYDGRVVKDA